MTLLILCFLRERDEEKIKAFFGWKKKCDECIKKKQQKCTFIKIETFFFLRMRKKNVTNQIKLCGGANNIILHNFTLAFSIIVIYE